MTKPIKWHVHPAKTPPSLIRAFTVRMKKPWVLSYPLSAQRRLWSDWADAQADLSIHDKTNEMACVPSEDSDQPGHLPSLIRVFALRMKKASVLSYPIECTSKTLIRLGECSGWSESSPGAHAILLVLSWGLLLSVMVRVVIIVCGRSIISCIPDSADKSYLTYPYLTRIKIVQQHVLVIHGLYGRSHNSVVKTLELTSYMTLPFNMADVNINERDSFIATPTLKNAGDRKVCKKKTLSWLFVHIEKSTPLDHCFASLGSASWCQTVTLGWIFLSAPHTHASFL